jgi:hypothetical protein
MVAASKEMAEFVSQEDSHKRQGEGKAAEQGEGTAIEKFECIAKDFPRDGLVISEGKGEMSAGDETCA